MKKYSKVSKVGIILSTIAMMISGVGVLYSDKIGMTKGSSVSIFCCVVAVVYSRYC